MNKKGFITHPITVAVVTFILGIILTVLLARNIIPLNVNGIICG